MQPVEVDPQEAVEDADLRVVHELPHVGDGHHGGDGRHVEDGAEEGLVPRNPGICLCPE